MSAVRSLYHLVRADFLERTRRYSFLIVLGLTVWAGYVFVPPDGAGYSVMTLGDYRGLYNSAWIGTMVAIMASVILTLAGFYLVKNAVERDERTGVGQIIATTPISKLVYVLGKALSNLAVLSAMVAVLAVVALAMQLIRGEDPQLNLWSLWSPFVLVVLPAMAVVAATAVLFETIGFLRGGFGNISYFFIWVAVIMFGATLPTQGPEGSAPINDLFGLNIPLAHMTAAARAVYPAYDGSVTIGITDLDEGMPALQTFEWAGMAWTTAQVAGRLLWAGAALGLALLAGLFFNRFDAGAYRAKRARPARTESVPALEPPPVGPAATLAAELSPAPFRFSAAAVVRAELRLLLKGQRWWWYAGALGLIAAGVLAPPEAARPVVLPLAWIWPVLIWSGLGVREARHATGAMVFSAARPLTRQLPAVWLAGVSVAVAVGGGVFITLARMGDAAGMLGWAAGAVFVPTLALALGVWSGGSKLFEVIYLLWWYTGPLNSLVGMDFMGARTGGLWRTYLVLTLALLAATVVGRWRQLRYA